MAYQGPHFQLLLEGAQPRHTGFMAEEATDLPPYSLPKSSHSLATDRMGLTPV